MSASRRLSGFAWLATGIAVTMLVLVAIGGAVRATDSGLACPTWPGCFSGGDFLPAWQWNVWLEHTHRLVAGLVAALTAVQLVWALRRMRQRRAVVAASAITLVLVVVQAGLGALVVLQLLRAELVTAHLGMAMVVVACQTFIAATSAPPVEAPLRNRRALAVMSGVAAAMTFAQTLVGAHVTGIGAGLVYAGPGQPALGVLSVAPATTPAHWFNVAHRVLALAVVAAVALVVVRARRAGASGWLWRLPLVAAVLVAVQVVLGVANLASDLSPLTVIPHLAVASWIWAVLVLHAVLSVRALPSAAPARSDDDVRVAELA